MRQPSSAPANLCPSAWEPAPFAALEALLAAPDLADQSAVFDWDNTCIAGDVGDAAFRWQLDTLTLALPPHALAALWRSPWPALAQLGHHLDHAEAILERALAAWRLLWPLLIRGELQAARTHPARQDFRYWLWQSYAHLLTLASEQEAPTALVYGLLARMWGGQPQRAPAQCVSALLGQPWPEPSTWLPADTGRTGPAATPYTFHATLRPHPEMFALISLLQDRGVRTAVVSASFRPLVQAIAGQLGCAVPSGRIFGLELAAAAAPEPFLPDAFAPVLAAHLPVTYRTGKVAAIVRHQLAPPVLVAGDAMTDYEMLLHWPQTRVRLLLDRPNPPPPLQALHAQVLLHRGGQAVQANP